MHKAETFWAPHNLKLITDGVWLYQPELPDQINNDGHSGGELSCKGLSIDSRTVERGQIFLAYKGINRDGHNYLLNAMAAGAGMIIVDQRELGSEIMSEAQDRGVYVLQVSDTNQALSQLAVVYRKILTDTKIIAVTGTNGKTTVKHIIDVVLGRCMAGRASPKSYNNHVGVPLTLLSARGGVDKYLVVEIGTNAPGEVAALAEMVEPDIVVITSVGAGHLEGLQSIEGVASEKASLLKYVKSGGMAFVTADSEALEKYIEINRRDGVEIERFGFAGDADYILNDVQCNRQGISFSMRSGDNDELSGDWSAGLLGAHNAMNALAAILVARHMGVSNEVIREGLGLSGSLLPVGMRLEPLYIEHRDIWILNDAYNANPDSMLAALDTFVRVTDKAGDKRRTVILGDMLELGDKSEYWHKRIGTEIANMLGDNRISNVIMVGAAMKWAYDMFKSDNCKGCVNAKYFPAADDESIKRIVNTMIFDGDQILLKGSRGIRLERIIELLNLII